MVFLAPTQIYPERLFRTEKLLGYGGQAEVFQCKAENQNQYKKSIALKIYNSFDERELEFIDWIRSQKSHSNFMIEIYEKLWINGKLALIMELGRTDLKKFINEGHNRALYKNFWILQQVVQPIKILHQNDYLHRDIKPENYVLVDNSFKLIDFGCVKKSCLEQRQSNVGTEKYKALEVNEQYYSEKIDIWSLGCIFYEILTGQELFFGSKKKELDKQKYDYKNKNTAEIQQKIKQIQQTQLEELIFKMIDQEPKQRPSPQVILQQLEQIQKTCLPQKEDIYQTIYVKLDNSFQIKFSLTATFKHSNKLVKYVAQAENYSFFEDKVAIIKIKNNDFFEKKLKIIDNLMEIPDYDQYFPIIYKNKSQSSNIFITELGQISLEEYLNHNKNLKFQDIKSILLDISKILQFSHQNKFCLRDIHIENFYQINNKWNFIGIEQIIKYKEQPKNNQHKINYKITDVFLLGCLFYQIIQRQCLFPIRNHCPNWKKQIQNNLSYYGQQKNEIKEKIEKIQSEYFKELVLKMVMSAENNIGLEINQVVDSFKHEIFDQELEELKTQIVQYLTNSATFQIENNLKAKQFLQMKTKEFLQNLIQDIKYLK